MTRDVCSYARQGAASPLPVCAQAGVERPGRGAYTPTPIDRALADIVATFNQSAVVTPDGFAALTSVHGRC
jgi:hypothetical protein